MRLLKNALLTAVAAISAISCSQKPVTGPAVLIGDVQGDCGQLTVVSFPTDKFMDYHDAELIDGHFEIVLDDVTGFIDVAVDFDGETFGARVNACDTLKMTVVRTGNGHFDVSYDGATEKESRIWTDWYNTYGYMGQYNIRADADPDITLEQSLAMLAANDSAFRAKNAGLLDKYHIRRADLGRDFLKAVLLESDAYCKGENQLDNPDYAALVKNVDPNDPLVVSSGLLPRWANYVRQNLGDDDISRNLGFMKKYSGKIRNGASRKLLADNMAFTLRTYPDKFDDGTSAEYIEAIRTFVPECPELAAGCIKAYKAFKSMRRGMDMPDVELTGPDGGKVMLSSLYGKVIYLDIWATWCGPCCREIPYMAALAERLKGHDDIMCISVSVDGTTEPWLEQLAAEKPAWPQYWLDPDAHGQFSEALNINAIPRFIIVDKSGKIYDANSIRPSDENIDEVLSSVSEL